MVQRGGICGAAGTPVEEECTNAIVNCSYHPLDLAVLWGSVGAGETEDGALSREKGSHG